MSRRIAEAVVALNPGEAVTRLVLGVAVERGGGRTETPRATSGGTHVTLPKRMLRGGGELIVTMREDRTIVRLEGEPPPWPLSIGWEARTLRRLLGRQVVKVEAG